MSPKDALLARLKAVEAERDEWHERYREERTKFMRLASRYQRLWNKHEAPKTEAHKRMHRQAANAKSAQVVKAATQAHEATADDVVREHVAAGGRPLNQRGVKAELARTFMDRTGLNKNSAFRYIREAIARNL